jgi:hypothetical protein
MYAIADIYDFYVFVLNLCNTIGDYFFSSDESTYVSTLVAVEPITSPTTPPPRPPTTNPYAATDPTG